MSQAIPAVRPGPDTAAGEAPPARTRRHRLWRAVRGDVRWWTAVALLVPLALMAVAPGLLTWHDLRDCDLGRSLGGPTPGHPFGFDLMGCDYYTLTVHGARRSLTIGVAVVVSSAAIAVVLGALAGYFRGTADALISAVTDAWLSVPLLLGGIFFLSFIEDRGVLQVSLVLTLLAWPTMVRIVRSSVMETKTEEYVLASQALGASHWRLVTRHVVPGSLRSLTVYAALFTGTTIAAEAILSYMGVGLQLPDVSWGLLLVGIGHRLPGNPHLLIPGVCVTAAVFGFILLSDALRDATDPGSG